MFEELEPGGADEPAPRLQPEIGAVAQALLTLDVRPTGIATEERAPLHQRSAQIVEHPSQLLGRHVKEDGVREDAFEPLGGQLEGEEVLMPLRQVKPG